MIDESSTDIRRIRKPWIVSHKHKTVSNDLYYKLCDAHDNSLEAQNECVLRGNFLY